MLIFTTTDGERYACRADLILEVMDPTEKAKAAGAVTTLLLTKESEYREVQVKDKFDDIVAMITHGLVGKIAPIPVRASKPKTPSTELTLPKMARKAGLELPIRPRGGPKK